MFGCLVVRQKIIPSTIGINPVVVAPAPVFMGTPLGMGGVKPDRVPAVRKPAPLLHAAFPQAGIGTGATPCRATRERKWRRIIQRIFVAAAGPGDGTLSGLDHNAPVHTAAAQLLQACGVAVPRYIASLSGTHPPEEGGSGKYGKQRKAVRGEKLGHL
jgi:hypothetical protein